jgi:ketosteroid isomerase-like protein
MGAKENTEVVRRGYEAFQKGDLAAFDALLSEGCVWHVPGRSQLAGDKKGRRATVEYYAKLGELSEGSIHVDVHDIFANDEHVVGLHRASAQRSGKSYDTTEVIVFHVAGGQVTEAWEHPFNLYGLDEVFA